MKYRQSTWIKAWWKFDMRVLVLWISINIGCSTFFFDGAHHLLALFLIKQSDFYYSFCCYRIFFGSLGQYLSTFITLKWCQKNDRRIIIMIIPLGMTANDKRLLNSYSNVNKWHRRAHNIHQYVIYKIYEFLLVYTPTEVMAFNDVIVVPQHSGCAMQFCWQNHAHRCHNGNTLFQHF